MPLFSEEIQGKTPDAQRRLYTLFQRAVKAGEVPALKLLTRFDLTGSKGQGRQVFEYAYTTATAEQVRAWIAKHEKTPAPQGVTAEDVQGMTDEQLTALIKAQRKPVKRRNTKRKAAATDGGDNAS
ncbi:hypothetical protein [Deinococcus murrayi]|uniref:hypothetical protein n=1 Tax=Deinococcus murrayi TaxID=68910 RepID=UPI0004805F5E|nr:hypothetical protein [Deinococcus murrayi]